LGGFDLLVSLEGKIQGAAFSHSFFFEDGLSSVKQKFHHSWEFELGRFGLEGDISWSSFVVNLIQISSVS